MVRRGNSKAELEQTLQNGNRCPRPGRVAPIRDSTPRPRVQRCRAVRETSTDAAARTSAPGSTCSPPDGQRERIDERMRLVRLARKRKSTPLESEDSVAFRERPAEWRNALNQTNSMQRKRCRHRANGTVERSHPLVTKKIDAARTRRRGTRRTKLTVKTVDQDATTLSAKTQDYRHLAARDPFTMSSLALSFGLSEATTLHPPALRTHRPFGEPLRQSSHPMFVTSRISDTIFREIPVPNGMISLA